jgi:hypothetical protein
MNIDTQLEINPDSLQLNIPEIEYRQQDENKVTLNPKTKRVFGIGISRNEIRNKMGERWEEVKDDLVTKPAFGVQDPDIDLNKYILWRYLTDTHHRVRGSRGLKYTLHQMLDRFDLQLTAETYDRLPNSHRQELENFLQADLRVRKLTINNCTSEIPARYRTIESFARVLLTLTIPYLLVGIGVFTVLGQPKSSLPGGSTFLGVGIVVIVGILLELIGIIAWMLVMRLLIPVSYLRYFLPRLPMRGITKRLADLFLPVP